MRVIATETPPESFWEKSQKDSMFVLLALLFYKLGIYA